MRQQRQWEIREFDAGVNWKCPGKCGARVKFVIESGGGHVGIPIKRLYRCVDCAKRLAPKYGVTP